MGRSVRDHGDPLAHTWLRSYSVLVERIRVDLDKEWLSVADICDYMGVSTFVVTRMLRSGGLAGIKMGREWRVARADFEDWLNAERFRNASPRDPGS
jgi:excisionase family DNA binding protein